MSASPVLSSGYGLDAKHRTIPPEDRNAVIVILEEYRQTTMPFSPEPNPAPAQEHIYFPLTVDSDLSAEAQAILYRTCGDAIDAITSEPLTRKHQTKLWVHLKATAYTMALALTPRSLGTLPLFVGLMEGEIDYLLSGGQRRFLPKGKTLFHQGEAITHFYLIVSGTVRLHRLTVNGHEKTLDIVRIGQPFCESEMMDGCHNHRASADVVDDVMVIQFPMRWLKDTAAHYGRFALNLASLISQQAHMAEVEVEHQATMCASQLVSCFLQRLCVLYHFDPKKFDLPYSKTLIASHLGMGISTLSRALMKIKKHGITVEGSQVSFHDVGRAGQHVCGSCSIADSCIAHRALNKKEERFAYGKFGGAVLPGEGSTTAKST